MLKTSAVIELSTKVMSLFIALGDLERCNETIDRYADAQLSGTVHDIEHKQKREAAWKKVQEITAVIFMVVTNESTAEQERDELLTILRSIVVWDGYDNAVVVSVQEDEDLRNRCPTIAKWIPETQ